MANEGNRPAWIDSILAEVEDLPESRTSRPQGAFTVTADFLPGASGAIIKAAGLRRLSAAAFVRRAALAMAAHDLDIPLSDLLARDPRMSRQGGFPVDDPAGIRFGAWEIESLKT